MNNDEQDKLDEIAMYFINIKNEEIAQLKDKLERTSKAGNQMIQAGINNRKADKEKYEARILQLEERLETLREAGDALAYCFRHAQLTTPEEVMDAMREWQEARNHG